MLAVASLPYVVSWSYSWSVRRSSSASACLAHRRTRNRTGSSYVKHWDGGISNGVRERLAQANGDIVVPKQQATRGRALAVPALDNVQMNGDSDPPLPQDEPSIAASLDDPMNAVASSNDYTGDGFWIGSTTDGGQTWNSQWKDPKFSFDGSRCFASDPSVAYSLRDHAFYLSTLCYFTTTPASEVQVWKSLDGGATWSSSLKPALVVTNHAPDGSIDASIFNDKELMAVDNSPSSPHFGRIYVTWTKFHMTGGSFARSDYCPIQAAYTDSIPTADPSTSVWTRTPIVADAPGTRGEELPRTSSRHPWSTSRVDSTSPSSRRTATRASTTRCSSRDRRTEGPRSGPIVRVDQPGWFADNPNANDNPVGEGPRAVPEHPLARLRRDAAPARARVSEQRRSHRLGRGHLTADFRRLRSDVDRAHPHQHQDRTARPLVATSSSQRSGWTPTASGSRSGRTPGSIRPTT